MSNYLIEKARTNRLIALEVLKQREGNLFVLANARKTAKRRNGDVLFVSRRAKDCPSSHQAA